MNLNSKITDNPVTRWAAETVSEDAARLKESVQTLAMLSTREYWRTVQELYPKDLPDSRFLRAAAYIFTVDGQLAYKRAKLKRHP